MTHANDSKVAPARCLSVVMPCFNEQDTIAEVIHRVLASPFVAELIVVDDGSDDGSVARVREISHQSSRQDSDVRVRLLIQPRNMGKGAALRRGLAAAQSPYVVIQDADLEYDPRDYETLLGPLFDGRADVVFGSRFHTHKPHRVLYYWHAIGNQVLTMASNMVTNLNLTDMETCYKVFKQEVVRHIVIEEDRFGFEPEITAKVAQGHWRIYEVGISYSGRTYAEGKKIGWKDGVRALYCIARYGLGRSDQALRTKRQYTARPFSEAEGHLTTTLENLDDAHNYGAWLADLIKPHAHGRILEIGAGHGTISQHLAGIGPLWLTDLSDDCVERLRQRFSDHPEVTVQKSDVTAATSGRTFDTVVMINVLEHIENDDESLRRIAGCLSDDGHAVILVPASERLFSQFDADIGHHRRYGRGELIAKAYQAGLEVVDVRYVNSVGALAWWLLARKLGRTPTSTAAVKFYDTVVIPFLRKLETRGQGPAFGQSLFMVARKAR